MGLSSIARDYHEGQDYVIVILLHFLSADIREFPKLSTAMQNVVVGHETEVNPPPFGSSLYGLDQLVPFQESTLPLVSTAMQKLPLKLLGPRHEIEVRSVLPSIASKPPRAPPVDMRAFPYSSTAQQ
jgi:hypothetical protein